MRAGKARTSYVKVGVALFVTGALVLILVQTKNNDLIAKIGAIATVGALLVAVYAETRRGQEPSESQRDLDGLTNKLATASNKQWVTMERDRLELKTPVDLSWKVVEELIDSNFPVVDLPAGRRAEFNELPGTNPTTQADLDRGGRQVDLYRIFAGLPRGLLVILGAAGSGKTGTAIMLAKEANLHRNDTKLKAEETKQIPVPILISVAGWDMSKQKTLADFVAIRMAATLPFLAESSGRRDGDSPGERAAQELLDDGHVLVVLDGFDEVSERLRRIILREIEASELRIILLARSESFETARKDKESITRAVVVELQAVSAFDAAKYLDSKKPSERPNDWGSLIGRLGSHPDGALAKSLSTPLALNLVKSGYQRADSVMELLNSDQIERLLFSRVITVRYRPKSEPLPRWDENQARKTFTFLAKEMDREWEEASPKGRFLTFWRILFPTKDILQEEIESINRKYLLFWWRIALYCKRWPSMLFTGLIFAGVGGIYGGLKGIGGGFVIGLIGWYVLRSSTAEPVRLRQIHVKHNSLERLLFAAVVVGGASGLDYSLQYGTKAGLAVLGVVGLAAAFMTIVETGLTGDLLAASKDDTQVVDPIGSWRNDYVAGIVRSVMAGGVFGIVAGLGYGLIGTLVEPVLGGGLAEPVHSEIFKYVHGAPGTLLDTLFWGLVFGTAFGFMYSHTWPARLAFVQLRFTQKTPVRMLSFLEDARRRGILHAEGPAYKFFHKGFQDYLAENPPIVEP